MRAGRERPPRRDDVRARARGHHDRYAPERVTPVARETPPTVFYPSGARGVFLARNAKRPGRRTGRKNDGTLASGVLGRLARRYTERARVRVAECASSAREMRPSNEPMNECEAFLGKGAFRFWFQGFRFNLAISRSKGTEIDRCRTSIDRCARSIKSYLDSTGAKTLGGTWHESEPRRPAHLSL